MQEIPAEGEIDWIPVVDALVASPQVGHTAYSSRAMTDPRVSSWGLAVQPTSSPWNTATLANSGAAYENIHSYGSTDPQYSAQDYMDADHSYAHTQSAMSALIRAGQFAMTGEYSDSSALGRSQAMLPAPLYTPIGQAPGRDNAGSTTTSTELRTGPVDADPPWLDIALTSNIMPLHTEAVMAMPYHDSIYNIQAPKHGVIRFIDPPFYVTRGEVVICLGKAKVVSQPALSHYRAVHILMERETGKTQDVFVEVESNREARLIVEQFEQRNKSGRSRTLGKARAKVEMSSQDRLLRAVFPQARKVRFVGGSAIVDTDIDYYYEGVPAVGFDGFLGNEECALLSKWLDSPNRSPFAQNCQNRPYENVITIFHKYPLDNPSIILMSDCRKLFDIALIAVKTLCTLLRQSTIPQGLTEALLQELVVATSGSRLLSDQQKAVLLQTLGQYGFEGMVISPNVLAELGGMHKYAQKWPFIALQRSNRASDKMLDFYGKLIREYNKQHPPADMTPLERQAFSRASKSFCTHEPFMGVRIPYSNNMRDDLSRLSWRQAVKIEIDYISTALRHKCPQDRAPVQEAFGTRFRYGV